MAEEGTAGTGTGRPATTIGGGRTIGVGTTDAVAGGTEEAIMAEIGVVSGSCDEAELEGLVDAISETSKLGILTFPPFNFA